MAGVSEMPFRVIAFEMGAGLATTELISAKGIFHKNARTQQYLRFDPEKEVPYSLQLFGGDELAMSHAAVEAAKIGAQIIDINMGCPVKKVTQTGSGSALLCDTNRAASLVKAMRLAVGEEVPITVKIRTGWDAQSINCIEMGKKLEQAGCAAIALHGRTRAQGYSGKADWNLIKELKDAVRIPVIGNGDVACVEEANLRLRESGCDAIMIGRGALGNPWIFRELMGGSRPTAIERRDLVLRHFKEHIEHNSLRSFRTHLVWYSKGFENAGSFREQVMHLDQEEAVLEAIYAFFSHRLPVADQEMTDLVDYRQAFG
jgi:nifR3 family TIM-barrel protein